MSPVPHQILQHFVSAYGYWAVALFVGLESMGIPLPGETILVLAAIYSATEPSLSIWIVVVAAAAGAIIGDNAGFWIGRTFGYALLMRYGRYIGLSAARIKVGQYLFRRHGGKVVFFGRFIALLRILAASLAGVNRMPWQNFLVANAAGGVLWATVFGFGGFYFGKLVLELYPAFSTIIFATAAVVFFGAGYLIRRFEHQLTEAAERERPGTLEDVVPK